MKQLKVISRLDRRVETIQSLYAKALLEYSLYEFKKEKLLKRIDHALQYRLTEDFHQLSRQYKRLLDEHKHGKKIIEKGFELHLSFNFN